MYSGCYSFFRISYSLWIYYSKEPKSVTTSDLFTFFRTDLIQSESSWKLSLISDCLMFAWKNASLLKEVTLFGSLL